MPSHTFIGKYHSFQKYLLQASLLLILIGSFFIVSNNIPTSTIDGNSQFKINSIDTSQPSALKTNAYTAGDIQKFTDYNLSLPLEGELSSYQLMQITSILSGPYAKIIDQYTDDSGITYILGNYDSFNFDFSATGLLTIGSSVSFVSGYQSTTSSFILAYDSSGNFQYGKQLDFDDDFDYYMVSMEYTGTNFIFLAENRSASTPTAYSQVDITLFNYTSDLLSVQYATFGGFARETLGIPTDLSFGMAEVPVDLLEIDSVGNIIIAGITHSPVFHPMDKTIPDYEEVFNFANTNYTAPVYNNLTFSSDWTSNSGEYSGVTDFSDFFDLTQDTFTGNSITQLPAAVEINALTNTYDHIEYDLSGYNVTSIESNVIWITGSGTQGVTWAPGIGIRWGDTAGISIHFSEYGGNSIHYQYWINNQWGEGHKVINPTTSVYLRIELNYTSGSFEYFWSYDHITWTSLNGDYTLLNGADVNTKSLNDIDLSQKPIVTVGKFSYDGAGSNVNLGDDLTDVNYDGSLGIMGTSQFGYLAINSTALNLPTSNNTINTISFNKSANSASMVFTANVTGLSVGFYDTLGYLLYSKPIYIIGVPKLIEYKTLLPIIKSIKILGIPDDLSHYFSISNLVVMKNKFSTTLSDFDNFNGNANEAIQGKIPGVYFNNWVAYNSSGSVPNHSGDFGIFISDIPGKTIVFDEPTIYVSFYGSSLPGDTDHTATIYDENNTPLESQTFSPGTTFIEFSLNLPKIKYVDFSAWTGIDYAIDDFSFLDQENNFQPFILKLDSSFNYLSSIVLRTIQVPTQVAITSLELNNTDNVYIAGISNGNFSEMGMVSPYQSLSFVSTGSAFITSFDSSLNLDSMTTVGGVDHSAIYDLHFNNSKMYAVGQSLSDNLILNPNIPLDGFQPSNGSGFIAEITSDWNIPYFLRVGDPNLLLDESAVTQIETQSAYLIFSGSFYITPSTTTFPSAGIFAFTQLASLSNAQPFVGILNNTRDVAFNTIIEGYYNQNSAFSVNPNSGEVIWTDHWITALNMFSINDTDSDGLSNYNELNVYGTNEAAKDTDGDGLDDGIEIYKYNSNPLSVDTDLDCIPDGWEVANGFNPTFFDANVDTDGDGLNSFEELAAGTNFAVADTDGDGLNDFEEVVTYRTNGTLQDSDFDGLTDFQEVMVTFTMPRNNDTDGDKLSDGYEVNTVLNLCDLNNASNCFTNSTDPFHADMDDDGLSDYEELMYSLTLPWDEDSDDDGFTDYEEYWYHNTDFWAIDSDGDNLNDTYEILFSQTNASQADSDSDGLNDDQELIYNTNPWLNDTDKDGLSDGFEIYTSLTLPLFADFDNDTLKDAIEYAYGSNSILADSDSDELPDWWEYKYGLDSSLNETYLDLDSDGMSNIMEFYNNTNPVNNDTDSDGFDDYMELLNGTNPNNPDTDKDTILDGDEVYIYSTNPLLKDSDYDQLSDPTEIFVTLSNPNSRDSDQDGLTDFEEFGYLTSLILNDTDGDNITDYFEINEYMTNPLLADSDEDGLDDYQELMIYLTDPLNNDTDNDFASDGVEISLGLNPNNPDADQDGLLDGEEILYSTNNGLNDTDSDGLSDGEEVHIYDSDPNSVDTDGDGMGDYYEASNELKINQDDAYGDPDKDSLRNFKEMQLGTDPNNPDSDFDGYKDGYEVDHDMDPLSHDDPPNNADRLLGGAQENPLAAAGGSLALGAALFMLVNLLVKRRRKLFGE